MARRSTTRRLAQFESKIDGLVVAPFRVAKPSTIYHYTNWKGLDGIVTSKRFWATDYRCTNDLAELTTADALVAEIARKLLKQAGPVARDVLDVLLKNYGNWKITKVAAVFLACFSAARDKPSQWKRYGECGGGFCLGIRVLPNEPGPNDGLGRELLPVDYSRDSVAAKVEKGFKTICQEADRMGPTMRDVQRVKAMALGGLYRVAGLAAIGAKQPAWAEEEEWRLVVMPREGSSFVPSQRLVGERTIDYVPAAVRVDDRPIDIEEIVIGSRQDPGKAASRVEGLLKSAGYPSEFGPWPKMVSSGVPCSVLDGSA